MAFTNPSVEDFKTYFARDFPFGTDIDNNVLDADITKAQSMTDIEIPDALFADQTAFDIGFNLLSAHYLVINLRSSSQGLSGQFSWLQNSRSVAGVSEGIAIPEMMTQNPMYAMYTKTNYGAQYLMMVYTNLIGHVSTVEGCTRP